MDWKTFVNLVDILIWPLVALVILLAYRKPLATIIASLGGRVTKFSVFEVSIELAALPEPSTPWNEQNEQYIANSEMSGLEASDSLLQTLFGRIQDTTSRSYQVIDIKDGHYWLISRVFIFTVFLQAMRGVKCVVFLRSLGEQHHQLMGLASPDAVRSTLGQTYSWLEDAFSSAVASNAKTHPTNCWLTPNLSPSIAGEIVHKIIKDPNMRLNCDPKELAQLDETAYQSKIPIDQRPNKPIRPEEWERLVGDATIWEHTNWLTTERVNKDLKEYFYEWDLSHYKDTPDIPSDQRARELLRRTSPFVALVNSKGEFKKLLDRQKLLEHVAQSLQRE